MSPVGIKHIHCYRLVIQQLFPLVAFCHGVVRTVSFISEWTVVHITICDLYRASLKLHLSSRFVLIMSFSVSIPCSTSPVSACTHGVPYINFVYCFTPLSQFFSGKAVPLSVLIVCGISFSRINCS